MEPVQENFKEKKVESCLHLPNPHLSQWSNLNEPLLELILSGRKNYRCDLFCGSGMFYPGSGSLNFSSRILLYIKRGMKNKTNLFLAPYGFRNKFY
jgi:hypothetical protein